MNETKTYCPKCGSESLYAGKKGFSGTKAVTGAILTGGIGLLAGTLGSNKVKITCLNCGYSWRPTSNLKATIRPANNKGKDSSFVNNIAKVTIKLIGLPTWAKIIITIGILAFIVALHNGFSK